MSRYPPWTSTLRPILTSLLQVLKRQADDGQAADGAAPAAVTTFNRDSQDIVLQFKRKLRGDVGGELLSVEAQVERLIQDARDPRKLAALYSGWAAWV